MPSTLGNTDLSIFEEEPVIEAKPLLMKDDQIAELAATIRARFNLEGELCRLLRKCFKSQKGALELYRRAQRERCQRKAWEMYNDATRKASEIKVKLNNNKEKMLRAEELLKEYKRQQQTDSTAI
ncbi:unnamed protein product, partial [Mesorhabditis spiculigera]